MVRKFNIEVMRSYTLSDSKNVKETYIMKRLRNDCDSYQ